MDEQNEQLSSVSSASAARKRLLAAAEEIFAKKGFDSATVREICREADVNIAAISYYFGDKGRLYLECLRVAHACADAGPESMPNWPAGTAAVAKLRGFIEIMVSRTHAPARPTAMQLLMREFAHPSAAGQEVIQRYIQPKAFRLRDILGELLPGADRRRLLMIGFSVIGQIIFYRLNRPVAELIFGKATMDTLDVAAVTDHITRFSLAALGLEPPYPFASAAGAGEGSKGERGTNHGVTENTEPGHTERTP